MSDLQDWRTLFPARAENTHKGTYGTLMTFCGSYGMAGAATLANSAAYRCGVGLVAAVVPTSIYPLVATAIPEAVFIPTDDHQIVYRHPLYQKATAFLVGCGLGDSNPTSQLVSNLLRHSACPIVVDADGINALVRHISILKTTHAPLVLTPHPAELSRLLSRSVEEIEADRPAAARLAAEQFHAVVVLKGHNTVIASPDGQLATNPTGNPGMAVAGSGDVLAGMIGGLVAQGLSAWDAARVGTYLHGLAGDRAAARLSQHAMLPSDMIHELGALFLELE